LALRTFVAAVLQRARHLGARRDALYLRSMERFAELRDTHAGETCVVIGNGPSMRGFDLAQLEGTPAFCLNRGYLMWLEQERKPDFLVVVNSLVIEQFADEIQRMGGLIFAPWLQRNHFDTNDRNLVLFEERWDKAFMTDPRRGLASLATVTNTTLQLAWHMGFTTVVLIGVDHHFKAASRGRPHQMVIQADDDVDHFRPDYFAPGTRWQLPDLELSEHGYRLARQMFERSGRRIVNATPDSRLEIFERATLSDILKATTPQGDRESRL
jgi:hypothetical protein